MGQSLCFGEFTSLCPMLNHKVTGGKWAFFQIGSGLEAPQVGCCTLGGIRQVGSYTFGLALGLGSVPVPKMDGKEECFFSDPVGRCSPLVSGLLTPEAVLLASVLFLSPLLLQDVPVCLGLHTCFQAP